MARKSRTITLYAPSIDKTIEDFAFSPATSYNTIPKDMRAALGDIDQAYPYDLKKRPIEDFKPVESGKTILVGTDFFERVLQESDKEIVLVQAGSAEKAWMVRPLHT